MNHMKERLPDHELDKKVHDNAKHLAGMHMEVGNPEKIAEALKEMPVWQALEYLFAEAEKHRKEGRHAKAETITEAARIIDPRTLEEVELELKERGSGKNQESQLVMRRLTPREVFEKEVRHHDGIELPW